MQTFTVLTRACARFFSSDFFFWEEWMWRAVHARHPPFPQFFIFRAVFLGPFRTPPSQGFFLCGRKNPRAGWFCEMLSLAFTPPFLHSSCLVGSLRSCLTFGLISPPFPPNLRPFFYAMPSPSPSVPVAFFLLMFASVQAHF